MAARREKRTRFGKNGKKAHVWLLPAPPVPEGDFLPPGFSAEPPPKVQDGETVTYFLYTEKRGIKRYLPMALKHFQRGFRAVLVTKAKLVFDQPSARVAGRVSGDQYEEALKWANRSVLDELHEAYVLSGGGTEKERQRTAKRYFKALRLRDEIDRKRAELEAELDAASVEMVRRFGKKAYPIEGMTLDPCSGPGDKVYWRQRGGGVAVAPGSVK